MTTGQVVDAREREERRARTEREKERERERETRERERERREREIENLYIILLLCLCLGRSVGGDVISCLERWYLLFGIGFAIERQMSTNGEDISCITDRESATRYEST